MKSALIALFLIFCLTSCIDDSSSPIHKVVVVHKTGFVDTLSYKSECTGLKLHESGTLSVDGSVCIRQDIVQDCVSFKQLY